MEFFPPQLLILNKNAMLLSFWYRKDIFHMGILSPTFERKNCQSILYIYAVLQVHSAQNSQYVRAAYFKVAWSEFL